MRSQSLYGMGLALAGALIISPDALLMRLSGLDGTQMLAWRGLLMGATMIAAWALLYRIGQRRGPSGLANPAAGLAVLLQAANAALFATGISLAPVSVVLFSVATVPIWAAILGGLFLGERTGRATIVTSAVVLGGIGLSVFGTHEGGGHPVIGALCGLGVSVCLASGFTIYRANRDLPILLTVGLGGLLAGLAGLLLSDGIAAGGAELLAIATTGVVILPASFFLISTASRHTEGANVSLFMLLETVIGPLIVWAAIGERVSPQGLAGGAIVVAALAVYLARERRLARTR